MEYKVRRNDPAVKGTINFDANSTISISPVNFQYWDTTKERLFPQCRNSWCSKSLGVYFTILLLWFSNLDGNVALDVAILLLRPTTELATTDIASSALAALDESSIRKVYLVGRRGPVQAACTAKELREILGIKDLYIHIQNVDLLTTPADEIEVETVDRTGTFLGSLWESKSNVALVLLDGGLARLQTSFGTDRIPDIHLLAQAEQSAKRLKLKIWESYAEGEEVQNGQTTARKQEEFKVVVTEVLGGGKFYVQAADQKLASIQQ